MGVVVLGVAVAQNEPWVNIDSVIGLRQVAKVVEHALVVEALELLGGWVACVDAHDVAFLGWLLGATN